MFKDSIGNSFTISFDFWFTDRKVILIGLEYQLDIGSSQDVNSPKDLIVAYETATRTGIPNKANIIARTDNLGVREYFIEIDVVRYPRESVYVHYVASDYIDDYRDPKFF